MNNRIKVKGKELQICTRCIYDERVSGIMFDGNGVCNYCHTMDRFRKEYHTGMPEGKKELQKIIDKIKRDGKRKQYDCVVGVSGGTDSSYLLVKLKEWGLRPLAVHYDNTWNTAIATENIKIMLEKLDIDLFTYVVDHEEADDIFKSFLEAGVQELDASTDLALVEVMYRAARKYGIKYIMEGHSYVTEGIAPINTMYFDGGYIKDIHRKFGKIPMKTYPLMTFWRFMYWMFVKRIKRIRPFWYIDYSKKEARELLQRNYGWKYYGGHHLENRITAINHMWLWYKRFNIDLRNLSLAAGVRMGVIDREEAIKEYFYSEPVMEEGILNYFKERMGYSDKDLDRFMNLPKKTYKDYKTYKKYFQIMRPVFYLCVKANLVPESFYVKYTSKDGL